MYSYFDRVIDRKETISEYTTAATNYLTTSLNFDPGNGISTEVVLGTQTTAALNFNGNYLILIGTRTVVNDGISSEEEYIKSRWWVLSQKRLRAGQYSLKLRRDVIADHLDIIESAPCYIEKGTIQNTENPLIFNPEEVQLNQIKKEEVLLKEKGDQHPSSPWIRYNLDEAWIVGYVARSYGGETFDSVYDVSTDYTENTLPYAAGTYKSVNGIKLELPFYATYTYQGRVMAAYLSKNSISFPNDTFSSYSEDYQNQTYVQGSTPQYVYTKTSSQASLSTPQYLDDVGDQMVLDKVSIASAFRTTYSFVSSANAEIISGMNGKTMRDTGTGKYYKINVSTTSEYKDYAVKSTSAFGVAIDTAIKKPQVNDLCSLTSDYNNVNGYTTINVLQNTYVITLVEYQPQSMRIKISSSRNRLNDAPYDMFAIPYSLNNFTGASIIKTYTDYDHMTYFYANRFDALHIAEAIGAKLGGIGGSSNVYDIQILPYCPISSLYQQIEIGFNLYDNVLYLPNLTEGKDYDFVKNTDEDKELGIIFWATSSSRTFDIPYEIQVEDPKMDNITKLYRLVSPNYTGMFEFSPAKNGGVNLFNVDITYKPFNPYIHVNPNFKKLYGDDFNDSRGLICGGDFSVAICDDKWASFEINNKNYQLIFDREVKNMDFTRGQERVGEAMDLITGTAAGAIQGGMAGGVAGAIVGGVASAAGGAIDIAMSEARYKEAKSLKTDLYNYNLGNIRALPASLTKSMSMNANFKFWPFLEVYDCSDEEKELLANKLRYDGMTVMKIDTISNFVFADVKSFVKGEIIRLPDLPEAADVAYEIYNEIKKGVYL